MKLSLSLLKKFIHLPTEDLGMLRHTLDDVGLEVEEVIQEGGDVVFKIETLAHRGDHLSAQGIARELSARFLIPMIPLNVVQEIPSSELLVEVSVETECCLRYALMSLEAGEKSVDLLNSILAEIGQPMHAFDRACVEGSIHVTTRPNEEEIVALDGKTYKVPPGSILICDSKKILAVAGVIGCQNSMVTSSTKSVLVESAAFDPVSIRKTAKKMGISTDASYAFERGCDREKVLMALKRLLALLPAIKKVGLYYYPGQKTPKRTLELSFARLRALLNASSISREEIEERLMFLGYEITDRSEDHSLVIAPSWREWNVLTETTVIEDFARVYGLNSFPLELPPLDYKKPPQHKNEIFLEKVESSLLGNGFFEVMTKSYYSQEAVSFLNELQEGVEMLHIPIKNSVEREYSHLKITNIIHLARLSEYNFRRGILSFKAYEFARLFARQKGKSLYEYERDVLSLAFAGRWHQGEWKEEESKDTKICLLKGVLESIYASLGLPVSIKPGSIPCLHPGYQAALYVNDTQTGYFGLIHPQLSSRLGLDQDLFYAELDAETLTGIPPRHPQVIFSDFPSIKRDLTLKVPKKGFATGAIDAIYASSSQFLQQVAIVNVFEKQGEDFRRVTYRLSFQSDERTLQHEEVDAGVSTLLSSLKETYSLCS